MRKIFAVLTYSSFLCFLVLNINAAEIEPIEGIYFSKVKHDYNEAAKSLNIAANIFKELHSRKALTAYTVIGVCFSSQKDYASAMPYFDIALKLEPENGYSYWNRALNLIFLSGFEKGLKDIKRSVELNPKNKEMAEKVIGMCNKIKEEKN